MTVSCLCDSKVKIEKNRDKTLKLKIAGLGDITGSLIWFSVKEDKDDLDSEAVITKKNAAAGGSDTEAKVVEGYIKETDETSQFYNQYIGIIEIYLVPADTVDLEEGNYFYDVVMQIGGGAGRKLQVMPPSGFQIRQPVTIT